MVGRRSLEVGLTPPPARRYQITKPAEHRHTSPSTGASVLPAGIPNKTATTSVRYLCCPYLRGLCDHGRSCIPAFTLPV
ncbi:hypothetical protein PJI17_24425 [Mycobacterium kansasii]